MIKNTIVLRAAVAMVLGSVPFASQAATSYGPSKPITLARELPATSVVFAGDYALTIPYNGLAGYDVTPSSGVSLIIRLSLTSGATFTAATADSMKCNYQSGTTSGMATALYSEIEAGGGAVFFRMVSGKLAADNNCVFSGTVTLSSGNKDEGYGMVVSSIYDTILEGGVDQTEYLSGTIISFAEAFSFGINESPKVTIDVTNPSYSTKFVTGTTVLSNVQTAVLGTLTYKPLGTSTALVASALSIGITAADVLNTVSITLSGTPLKSQGIVYVCSGTIPVSPASMTASVSGVATVTVPVTALQSGGGSVDLCYFVDGVAKIEKGTISFANPLTVLGNNNATVNGAVASSENALVKLIKNGVSVKVLNIPNAAEGATGNSVNVRIYNFGSTDADISGVLYETDPNNVAGKVTNTVNLGTVKSNAVMVLKAKDLETAFGKTWGGRAWLQLEGSSKDLRVLALMSTNGTLVNMSDRILEDGGNGCRGGGDC